MSAPKPADEKYNALCTRLASLQKEAGAMLAQSLSAGSSHPETARKIAEDFAREANEVAAEMKAWRLAHGYEA